MSCVCAGVTFSVSTDESDAAAEDPIIPWDMHLNCCVMHLTHPFHAGDGYNGFSVLAQIRRY